MKLRTYQAYTMAEALAAVKRDLGAEAVILNTRTFRRGGLLGIGRKTIVEVTATPSRKGEQLPEPKPASVGAAAARKAYGGSSRNVGLAVESKTRQDGVTEDDQRRTRRLAQALAAKYERKQDENAKQEATVAVQAPPPPPAPPADLEPSVATAAPVEASSGSVEPAIEEAPARFAPTSQRFILTQAERRDIAAAEPVPAATVAAVADPPKADRSPSAMQDELAAIKTMVGQVLQRQSRSGATPSPTMPAKLFDMYLKLIGQDISEELADTIINEVRDELSSSELDQEPAVREAVLQRLAKYIPVADEPIEPADTGGRPLTIALIGPTGVGKTTTLAKLAATFKLRQQRKVGLITSDTYRIAAVDQLRTYANIIGLPLQVALTPAEMRSAVHALSDCDVILIDTAGRGQNDTGRLAELKQFIEAASPHEVHLVLSSTANEKVLLREAEAFSEVGINKIVLTKLDEAVSFGMLINVVRQVGKELSFVTTGQEVPTHIEVGRADRLADLILGGEVHV